MKRYHKIVIEGYIDYEVREDVNLMDIARELEKGAGICTKVDTQEVSEEELPKGAKNFFGKVRENIEDREIEEDEKAKVTFHPQAWQNDYAVPADPEGETEFIVPLSDATDEDGNLLENDTHESDVLKDHGNAPRWIREWNGPFYIEVERL